MDEPAHTLGASGLAKGRDVWYRNGNQKNVSVRHATEPAPTVLFGNHMNSVEWIMEKKEDRAQRKARGAGNVPRSAEQPAATIDTRADLAQWTHDRPATTTTTTDRVSVPGHHDENESGSQQRNAVRVTVREAAILQSFPADYPWQGSRTAQFRAIGNAIPPLLAFHILRALIPQEGIAARFWPKVQIGLGCWEWRAAKNEHGYGVMRPEGQRTGPTIKAHRVAWEIANGPLPDGACVLHRCDNPACVRPSHLFLGSQADNLADMRAKGRGNIGVVNGHAKLTDDDVRVIRQRVAAGEMQKDVAASFGVANARVSEIVNRKAWTHVV